MHSRTTSRYKNHRFPPTIIAHAVWLYHRFSLSFRDVEELLAERGVTVTHEAIRLWCLKFGQAFPKKLRHRRGRPGDTWHSDELFIRIRGKRYYLWRAVDQDGQTLDILVQKRRNTGAAKRFFRKLLKGLQFVPNQLVNDKLQCVSIEREQREQLVSKFNKHSTTWLNKGCYILKRCLFRFDMRHHAHSDNAIKTFIR